MSKKPTSREKQTRREFKHADALMRMRDALFFQALRDLADEPMTEYEPREELEKAA